LPTWCNCLKLQIDEINTAHGYGYGKDDIRADLKFLTDRPSNKLLIQQSGTRQDGAWFFSDNRYAGSLAVKFYSNAIPQKDHRENKTSSDIRCSFLQADGANKNPSLSKIREDFIKSGRDTIKGTLQIHLEFPRVQGKRPFTNVMTTAAGVEDVMVYIDMEKIDDFFYDGIDEHKKDIISLLEEINQICDSVAQLARILQYCLLSQE
jgi:hypothetical protein